MCDTAIRRTALSVRPVPVTSIWMPPGTTRWVTSDRMVTTGAHRLGVHAERLVRTEPPAKGSRTGITAYTLLIDGEPAGTLQTPLGFHTLISWSGLDIGRDRGSPVSHYEAPFEFEGRLLRVTVTMHNDQKLDGDAVGNAQMARQ